MPDILVPVVNGITIAMAIYLIASGLSLVFGVLGVLNFAHGSLYMCGAFFLLTLMQVLGEAPSSFWVGLLLVPFLVAGLGLLLEMLFLRPLYRTDPLYQLLLTYALVLIMSDLARVLWGAEHQAVARPPGFEGAVQLLGYPFPRYQIGIVLPCSLLTMLALSLGLKHTRLGRLVRAATQDREMLDALGINVRWLYSGVFALGAWLAGLGGVIAAPLGAIYPGMDLEIILDTFIVVVIGGLGSLPGTALGALIFGLLRSFGILLLPQYESLIIFVLMAVVLTLRPQGLMGTRVHHRP
ncbi:MAG: branched-chain amino acid ABC transporter permease [Candidatus Tectimicrobiota bacterium]